MTINKNLKGGKVDAVRLGVLLPALNTVVEPDMYRMVPPQVTVHFSRLPTSSDSITVENLLHLEDHLEESLRCLAKAEIKAVAFACTAGSFIKGPLWDTHLIERMEKIVAPATTTSESIISALRSLKVTRLALVTPYPDPINELMEAYIASQGFHVVNLRSFRPSMPSEIKRVQPEVIYELSRSADTEEAQAVLISCTGFQAVPIIDALEREIQKPVISSNQATLWRLMMLSGVNKPLEGYGCLLRNMMPQDKSNVK